MSDSISFKGRVLPSTYRALESLAALRNWEWFQLVMEPEWVAWLVEILKQSDDHELLFPHGKWATIQNIQGAVAVAAASERWSAGDRTETK